MTLRGGEREGNNERRALPLPAATALNGAMRTPPGHNGPVGDRPRAEAQMERERKYN